MSVDLLCRRPQWKVPALIIREQVSANSLRTLVHKVKSHDVPRIVSFNRESFVVRKGQLTDPAQPSDSSVLALNVPSLELSIRSSILMFLALSFVPGRPVRLIVTSRLSEDLLMRISDLVQLVFIDFAELEVEIYTGQRLDDLYAEIEQGGSRRGAGRSQTQSHSLVCLAALGTTTSKHVALTNHFAPDSAIYGIHVEPLCDFRFYSGEMWLHPFPNPKIPSLYLFTIHSRERKQHIDPVRNGTYWESSLLYDAALRHARVNNELDMYLEPESGANRYLMSRFPNNFSHMYVYYAIFAIMRKTGTRPARDQLMAILELAFQR